MRYRSAVRSFRSLRSLRRDCEFHIRVRLAYDGLTLSGSADVIDSPLVAVDAETSVEDACEVSTLPERTFVCCAYC